MKIPMKIGVTVQKVALARWSRTFSALYGAGVPIMVAIEVTGKTSGNWVIEQAMVDVVESVKSGGQIATPLREIEVFPPMVSQMITVGEETGGLDTMLNKVADFYEDEVAAAVKAMTSILEPIMIIFVGAPSSASSSSRCTCRCSRSTTTSSSPAIVDAVSASSASATRR